MNINIFFLLLIGGLAMIFVLFKPLDLKARNSGEIPLLELEDFKIIELGKDGLSSIMKGSTGLKYSDRYLINDLDYTDNTNKLIANIKSNHGVYKGEMIYLKGDVVYTRADGLSFRTQKAKYNQKTDIVVAQTKYVSYINEHRATGSWMQYNNALGKIKSKNIFATYKLKER